MLLLLLRLRLYEWEMEMIATLRHSECPDREVFLSATVLADFVNQMK